jgi:hypothetical protein
MKTKHFLSASFILMVIILMNLNLVISSKDVAENNLNLLAFTNKAFADPESDPQCQNCVAGGPGTLSCEYTIGPVTWSVTCQTGYYACCKATGASCCA